MAGRAEREREVLRMWVHASCSLSSDEPLKLSCISDGLAKNCANRAEFLVHNPFWVLKAANGEVLTVIAMFRHMGSRTLS